MSGEGSDGADDGAEVSGVGDPIRCDEETVARSERPIRQIHRVGISIGLTAQDNALVDGVHPRQAIQLRPSHLEKGDSLRLGELEGLLDPLVVFNLVGQVECGGRNVGPEGFHHAVSPRHDVGRGLLRRGRVGPARGAGALLVPIPVPIFRLRGRTLSFERLPSPAATASGGTLLPRRCRRVTLLSHQSSR